MDRFAGASSISNGKSVIQVGWRKSTLIGLCRRVCSATFIEIPGYVCVFEVRRRQGGF